MHEKSEDPSFFQTTVGLTNLIDAVNRHEEGAEGRLFEFAYDELRQIADRLWGSVPPGDTLQATALVHEAYIKLIAPEGATWVNRSHFYFAAARAMHDVLVAQARRHQTKKRGGDRGRVSLDIASPTTEDSADHMLRVGAFLEELQREDPAVSDAVMLRHFGGLPTTTIARVQDVSASTVRRRIQLADAIFARHF